MACVPVFRQVTTRQVILGLNGRLSTRCPLARRSAGVGAKHGEADGSRLANTGCT